MPKFTIEEHDKRMREILNPPEQTGKTAVQKLREIGRRRRGQQPEKSV